MDKNHSSILPGITIGMGALIAAGAVLTEDVISFSIVAGVPVRVIKMRRMLCFCLVTDNRWVLGTKELLMGIDNLDYN
ncbi:MAG: hypothetical protein WKF66_19340 [Pedobacter sp.]